MAVDRKRFAPRLSKQNPKAPKKKVKRPKEVPCWCGDYNCKSEISMPKELYPMDIDLIEPEELEIKKEKEIDTVKRERLIELAERRKERKRGNEDPRN